MTETPKCPYCGEKMEVTHAFVNNATAAHKLVYTCFCRECGVYTPKRSTPEEALSAALHRAEPENHPLTLEEAQKQSKNGNVVWLEMPGKPYAVVAYVTPTDKLSSICCVYILSSTLTMHSKKYGKLWRCWPRKPTPEQMAAEKWEE